jgi:TetR/AcrR family transcriptional repressor of nem operon
MRPRPWMTFDHVESKDDLAITAAGHWETMTGAFFAAAPYGKEQDPLRRLLGYLDFRAAILSGDESEYTCLLGTLVQETYATHPAIREACDRALSSHIAVLTRDVEAAKQLYAPQATWTAESLGYFIQATLQGSFIFAKAKQSPQVVRQSLEHLRRYLTALFSEKSKTNRREKA